MKHIEKITMIIQGICLVAFIIMAFIDLTNLTETQGEKRSYLFAFIFVMSLGLIFVTGLINLLATFYLGNSINVTMTLIFTLFPMLCLLISRMPFFDNYQLHTLLPIAILFLIMLVKQDLT